MFFWLNLKLAFFSKLEDVILKFCYFNAGPATCSASSAPLMNILFWNFDFFFFSFLFEFFWCIIKLFPIIPNESQNRKNVDFQRHCILVAASNPYPLPTPVCQPQIQNLERSENTEAQTESYLSDVETLAKLFPRVCLYVYIVFAFPVLVFHLLIWGGNLSLVFIAVFCLFICHMSKAASKT